MRNLILNGINPLIGDIKLWSLRHAEKLVQHPLRYLGDPPRYRYRLAACIKKTRAGDHSPAPVMKRRSREEKSFIVLLHRSVCIPGSYGFQLFPMHEAARASCLTLVDTGMTLKSGGPSMWVLRRKRVLKVPLWMWRSRSAIFSHSSTRVKLFSSSLVLKTWQLRQPGSLPVRLTIL